MMIMQCQNKEQEEKTDCLSNRINLLAQLLRSRKRKGAQASLLYRQQQMAFTCCLGQQDKRINTNKSELREMGKNGKMVNNWSHLQDNFCF